MIYAKSQLARYQTRFSDGVHEGVADTTADKGGNHSGFRPHDLLEAALAACVNMTVRMVADHHGIPLRGVTAKVSLDRTHPDEVIFRYDLELDGELTEEQRDRLFQASRACPVRKTLSKRIRFERGAGA
ncbi:MAG: OsmC family protein [Terracidiphilus sp.]